MLALVVVQGIDNPLLFKALLGQIDSEHQQLQLEHGGGNLGLDEIGPIQVVQAVHTHHSPLLHQHRTRLPILQIK